jgi:hypothetical protein
MKTDWHKLHGVNVQCNVLVQLRLEFSGNFADAT